MFNKICELVTLDILLILVVICAVVKTFVIDPMRSVCTFLFCRRRRVSHGRMVFGPVKELNCGSANR
jgi:hypothetical protein